jgi:hypothetical protein
MAGAFEDFGLLPELVSAVSSMGWLLATDIQAECIPLILGGGDVMAAAETGSGKTGAFCLPLLQIVHETLRDLAAGKAGDDPKLCAMSPSDRDAGFATTPDGLVCQAREANAWHGGRASIGAVKGRFYYEATVTDEGLCRVGWSTRTAKVLRFMVLCFVVTLVSPVRSLISAPTRLALGLAALARRQPTSDSTTMARPLGWATQSDASWIPSRALFTFPRTAKSLSARLSCPSI